MRPFTMFSKKISFWFLPQYGGLSLKTMELAHFVPGLIYLPEFISHEEEANLLEFIDGGTWNTELKRRTQHYGYKYSYANRGIFENDHLGDLPIVFDAVCFRLVATGLFSKRPQQVIVNEYQPGQGIASHVDSSVFGPVIASLTLGSGAIMDFSSGCETKSMYLEPRSLVVLSGDARTQWKHGIPARKNDSIDGRKRPRGRRVSVTFRTLR